MAIEKVPLIGGFFDSEDEKAQAIYADILKRYEGMQLPDMAWQEYTPEELKSMGELTPEAYQASMIEEDPRLMGQQSAYLNQLKALADSGMSDEDAAVFDQAQRQSGQQARGAREATMANMAARGVAGSGMELLSKELANQQAAERSRASMMDQAAASARQKALYTQAYGGELGSQRDQGFRSEAANKDILNRFNELNVGSRNTAAAQNLANRQAIANQNVAGRNQGQQYNLEGRRGANQQGFANQMAKLGGVTQAMGTQAQSHLAQSEANAATRGAGLNAALQLGTAGLSGKLGETVKKKMVG